MLNMRTVYKIDSVNDANGKLKEVSVERRMKRFHISRLVEGASAWLINVDDHDESLQTSTVERISIFDNVVVIKTKNSEYFLKPVIEGV